MQWCVEGTIPITFDTRFRIPREPLGALGTEGDILIGWRAGDAISEDL